MLRLVEGGSVLCDLDGSTGCEPRPGRHQLQHIAVLEASIRQRTALARQGLQGRHALLACMAYGIRGTGQADQFFEGGLQHDGAGGLEHDHLLRRDGLPERDRAGLGQPQSLSDG